MFVVEAVEGVLRSFPTLYVSVLFGPSLISGDMDFISRVLEFTLRGLSNVRAYY